MKKILLFSWGILLGLSSLCGQQIPRFSTAYLQMMEQNPAMLPVERTIYELEAENFLNAGFRRQWTKLDDGPLTALLRYDRLFSKINMMGGLSLLTDKTGPTSNTGGFLRYAYQIDFGNYSFLSIGLAAGLYQHRYQGKATSLRDANDLIGLESRSRYIADFKLGIFYQTLLDEDNLLYMGASVPQLATTNIDVQQGADYFVYRPQHFNASIGWVKFIGGTFNNSGLNLWESSLSLLYVPHAPLQLSANTRLKVADLFWVGAGLATSFGYSLFNGDFLHVEVGITLGEYVGLDNQLFKLSYGFDRNLSLSGVDFGNSHELVLTYGF